MKYFMTDLETMGTDSSSDDILEIGILELNESNGYLIPGKVYHRKFFTAQKPKDKWIATNHKNLIEECRKVPMISASKVRTEILNYFKSCGELDKPQLVGLNLMSLDIPFLIAKEFLLKGDFHYRIYEMRGTINTAKTVLNLDENSLFNEALYAYPEIQLPDGKAHEAIYDCFKQAKTLNGIIRLLKGKSQRASI